MTPPAPQSDAVMEVSDNAKIEMVTKFSQRSGHPRGILLDFISLNNRNGWDTVRYPVAAYRAYVLLAFERHEWNGDEPELMGASRIVL